MPSQLIDLMSVVAHEFEHILGSDHANVVGSPSVYMHEVILPGVRLLPGLVTDGDEPNHAAEGLRYVAGYGAPAVFMAPLEFTPVLDAASSQAPEIPAHFTLGKVFSLRAVPKRI